MLAHAVNLSRKEKLDGSRQERFLFAIYLKCDFMIDIEKEFRMKIDLFLGNFEVSRPLSNFILIFFEGENDSNSG